MVPRGRVGVPELLMLLAAWGVCQQRVVHWWPKGAAHMAKAVLMKCEACGGDVSRYASWCTYCGHPVPRKIQTLVITIAVVIMVVGAIATAIYLSSPASP